MSDDDEDLKLADSLAQHAIGAVNELEDDLTAAAAAIRRLISCRTAYQNTIDRLLDAFIPAAPPHLPRDAAGGGPRPAEGVVEGAGRP